MGKLQENSKAGLLRKIEELTQIHRRLEDQYNLLRQESNDLFDDKQALMRALNVVTTDLIEA